MWAQTGGTLISILGALYSIRELYLSANSSINIKSQFSVDHTVQDRELTFYVDIRLTIAEKLH